MRRISSKKTFMYFSLSLMVCYCIFVLIAYNSNILEGLYDIKKCGIYYLISYVLIVAVSYVIDTQSRKEPAFLTLLCIPIFTLIFLVSIMMITNAGVDGILLVVVSLMALLALGYHCYKKWIHRILLIKNGYENILMGYVILHVFVVLYIAFKMIGLL